MLGWRIVLLQQQKGSGGIKECQSLRKGSDLYQGNRKLVEGYVLGKLTGH